MKHLDLFSGIGGAAFVAWIVLCVGGYYAAHNDLLSQIFGTSARVGPAALYPDQKLTPGKVATQDFKELTAVRSCGTYSQCHRNTTAAQKTQVCKEYPQGCAVPHEIDHFCPLALGCADDVLNLWAQPETNMWNGFNYGFHQKDSLEALMASMMKAGKISPVDAQNCLLKDWVACYDTYIKGKFGAGIPAVDPDNQ